MKKAIVILLLALTCLTAVYAVTTKQLPYADSRYRYFFNKTYYIADGINSSDAGIDGVLATHGDSIQTHGWGQRNAAYVDGEYNTTFKTKGNMSIVFPSSSHSENHLVKGLANSTWKGIIHYTMLYRTTPAATGSDYMVYMSDADASKEINAGFRSNRANGQSIWCGTGGTWLCNAKVAWTPNTWIEYVFNISTNSTGSTNLYMYANGTLYDIEKDFIGLNSIYFFTEGTQVGFLDEVFITSNGTVPQNTSGAPANNNIKFTNFSNNASTPKVNSKIKFKINISSASGLSYYRMSTNLTGTFINASPVSMGGSALQYFPNVTIINNATAGSRICARFWANNTAKVVNVSNLSCYTVNNSAPVITINQPANGTHLATGLRVNFSVADGDSDLVKCYLYVNGTKRNENTSMTLNVNTILNYTAMSQGVYYWFLNCTDILTGVGTVKSKTTTTARKFIYDSTTPSIQWLTPIKQAFTNNSLYTILVRVTDAWLDATNLTLYNFTSGKRKFTNTTLSLYPKTVYNQTDTLNFSLYGNGKYRVEECARDLASGSPDKPQYHATAKSSISLYNTSLKKSTSPYAYEMTDPYKVYFKNNSNTGEPVKFEKNGYYFIYDISQGSMRWRAQTGFPDRTDTLGGGYSSNSLDSTLIARGNLAQYIGAFSLTNATYELTGDMVKESFVLYGLPSIKSYLYLEYTGNIKFNKSLKICANNKCYKPSGTQDDFNTSGQIDFKDNSNNTIFYLPAPIVTGANGTSGSAIYFVKGSDAQMSFDLRIPTELIKKSAYPIIIDPSIKIPSTGVSDSLQFYDGETNNNITFKFEIYDSLNQSVSLSDRQVNLTATEDGKHITFGGTAIFNANEKAVLTYTSNTGNTLIPKNMYVGHFITSDYNLFFHHKSLTDKNWTIMSAKMVDGSYQVIATNDKTGKLDFDPITGGLNKACTNSSVIVFDNIKPNTTISAKVSSGAAYAFDTWTNSVYVNVTTACTDNLAGCNVTQYCLDRANSCTPNTTSFTKQVTLQNTSYFRYRSNDSTKNMEVTKSKTVKIDTTIPNINKASPASGTIFTRFQKISVDFNASDASGLSTWSVNNATNFQINSSGTLTNKTKVPVGTYTLNISVNDTLGQRASYAYTLTVSPMNYSIMHIEISVANTLLDSPTYLLAKAVNFSLSRQSRMYFFAGAGARKTSSPADTTLWGRVKVNGITRIDAAMYTLEGTLDRVAFTFPMFNFTGNAGTNNLTVEFRETGLGGVNVSNFSIQLIQNLDSKKNRVNTSMARYQNKYSSTTYKNIDNATIVRNYTGTTYLDIHSTFVTNGSVTTPVCYARKFNTGEITPTYSVYLATANKYESGGTVVATQTPSATGSSKWGLWCKSSDTDWINETATGFFLLSKDADNNNIPTFQNQSSGLTLTGKSNRIVRRGNYRVKNASTMLIVSTVVVQSTSGKQESTSSPKLYLNSSTLTKGNCYKNREVSMGATDNSDVDTVKMYTLCRGLSPNTNHNFTLWLDVATGETIYILNASLTGIETQELSLSETKVAPIIRIYSINDSETLSGARYVNITVTNPSKLGYNSTISLLNTAWTFNTTLLTQTTQLNTTSYLFNTSKFRDGQYIIKWLITSSTGNNNDTINVTLDNGARIYALNVVPASAATYNYSRKYYFNASVKDNEYPVVAVKFQFNGTNYTATNYTAAKYNYTIKSMAAGTFVYRWYANNTNKKWNNTRAANYVVNRAAPKLVLAYANYSSGTDVKSVNFTYGKYPRYLFQDNGTGYNTTRNQWIDGNWSTYYAFGNEYYYVNYSIPAKVTSAKIMIKYNSTNPAVANRSITAACLLKSKLRISINYASNTYTFLCHDGNSWIPSNSITGSPSKEFFEEGIWWYTNTSFAASESNMGDADCIYNLTRNGTLVGAGSIVNDTSRLSAGWYKYNYSNKQCTNYSATHKAGYLRINKATPAGNITKNGTSWTIVVGTSMKINKSESNTGDSDIRYYLFRNKTNVSTGDLTAALGVGVYTYKFNSSAGTNYSKATIDTKTLTVTVANGRLSLTMNLASPQAYPEKPIATCTRTVGEGTPILKVNGTVRASGSQLTLGAGTYNINCSMNATQNYTAAYNATTYILTKGNLTNKYIYRNDSDPLFNGTMTYKDPFSVNHSIFVESEGIEQLTLFMWRNRTANVSNGDFAGRLAAGTYEYYLNSSGNANYSATVLDIAILTINKKSSTVNLTINKTSANRTGNIGSVWNISGFSKSPAGTYLYLYKDGVLKANGTSYVYNRTTATAALSNISVVFKGNQNYTGSYATWYLRGNDTTAPTFTNISNITVEYLTPIRYDINATDNVQVNCFKVNNTNFTINCSGYLRNTTELSKGIYWLNISVNDTSNNRRSTRMRVNITDSYAPHLFLITEAVTATTATITTTFNEKANYTVFYGATTALGSNETETDFALSQSVLISGLTASTTYYYNVSYCDRYSHCVENGTYDFTTSAAATPPSGGGGGGSGATYYYCLNHTDIECPSTYICNATNAICYLGIRTPAFNLTSLEDRITGLILTPTAKIWYIQYRWYILWILLILLLLLAYYLWKNRRKLYAGRATKRQKNIFEGKTRKIPRYNKQFTWARL